mmetsp:Transcript_4886/g.8445  ORF Transcript_4886/g.8445 Transcript_4886/m.8445 type:complete len:314 (+) Transcript_4886:88-1029(+)
MASVVETPSPPAETQTERPPEPQPPAVQQTSVGRVTDPSLVQHAAAPGGSEVQEVAPLTNQPLPNLREVLLCVGWTFPAEQTVLQGQADYLDGSCLIYSEDRLLDVVDFRGAHSAVLRCPSQRASTATLEWSAGRGKGASVLHSGDVMSPDGGSHVIRVRLADLPAYATDCFFVISAYNCRNLSLFGSLNMRLFDAECPSHLLSKFTIADAGRASAVIVCSLARRLNAWCVQGFSRTCDATVRDYAPIEAAIAPLQEHHCRWRRRKVFVLLAALLESDRASLRDDLQEDKKDKILIRLFKLHVHLFQHIMDFV